MRSLEYSVETVGTRKAIAVLSPDGYVDNATSLNMDEAIDSILQQKIYLELTVKVHENWRKDEQDVKRFGYRTDK